MLELANVQLVKAVLGALVRHLGEANCTQQTLGGFPFHQAHLLQRVLTQYPEEAQESMGSLWELAKGPDRLIRMDMKDRSYLLQGGEHAYSWVWGEG